MPMGRVPGNEEIIAEYGKMLLKNPRSRVFVSMASASLRAGKPRLALDVLEKGLRHHPRMGSALTLKGRALLALGRTAEAKDLLESVAQNAPENLLARRLLEQIGQDLQAVRETAKGNAERGTTEPEEKHGEAIETLERWLNNAARMAKG
ncbi:MAG: tetratricopeptide repeat protein [Nitrospinae bacterium]|nr:tetratricopeptide repeat protein [Nitrospinota bacterium]